MTHFISPNGQLKHEKSACYYIRSSRHKKVLRLKKKLESKTKTKQNTARKEQVWEICTNGNIRESLKQEEKLQKDHSNTYTQQQQQRAHKPLTIHMWFRSCTVDGTTPSYSYCFYTLIWHHICLNLVKQILPLVPVQVLTKYVKCTRYS